MLRTRLLLFVTLLLLILPFAAQAQTGGSVINAASCQQAAVNAVINGPTHTAKNGDTIQIPAGICTWNSGITISGVGFTIVGAGTPNTLPSQVGAGTSTTTLIHNAGNTTLFQVTGIPFGQTMRISTLTIQPVGGAAANSLLGGLSFVGVCAPGGCPNIRVDNIIFPGSWDTPSVEVAGGGLILADNVFGVVDHNTATGTGSVGPAFVQQGNSAWKGVGGFGDNSWASADTFGTSQALYIENNLLSGVRGMENDVNAPGGSLGGVRTVCRDNTFNPQAGSGLCTGHGTSWAGRFRGPRQVEVYRNTVSASLADAGTGVNGGTEFVFENTWTGSWNKLVSTDVQRDWHSIAPWNYCDGAQPYDTNDGTIYASGTVTAGGTTTFSDSSKTWSMNQWAQSGAPYSIRNVAHNFGGAIFSNTATQYSLSGNQFFSTWNVGDSYQILRATVCIDQPGRGQGALLQGTTPVLVSTGSPGPVNEVLDPIYEWSDTHSGGGSGTPVTSASPRLLANRDFYSESANQAAQTSPTSPFNGTSGTGHGTLANRPTTCTTGVAYWATDQGSWNVSGDGQGSGQLYKCTSTNAWTLSYTPYTYPHPLITGGTSAGGSPNPPMSLTATVQ